MNALERRAGSNAAASALCACGNNIETRVLYPKMSEQEKAAINAPALPCARCGKPKKLLKLRVVYADGRGLEQT